MFYLDPETLKRYRIGTPFVYDGITYTSTGASHNTFISLGFQQVILRRVLMIVSTLLITPAIQTAAGVTRSATLAQTQESFCDQQVTSANSNLKSTDYLYARAAEATRSMTEDEPVLSPMALINQRDEVRDLCAANCTLIMGTKTIEELEKLIKTPATVFKEPGNPDSEVIPNPEPHLEQFPTFDEREYLKSTFMAPATTATKKKR